ncbi:hypothetical protein SAMN05444157_0872 [Frankineae bacterium MT45]|nr:hypothetical protein SAMN05444157_0872 [Frankineae bacterium MT45]
MLKRAEEFDQAGLNGRERIECDVDIWEVISRKMHG